MGFQRNYTGNQLSTYHDMYFFLTSDHNDVLTLSALDFMCRLAEYLQFYINDRVQNSPGWEGLTVILSDASVPGEVCLSFLYV